ncbi:MAG: zf-HC2 domain-containing protein [Candidatus Omnitrophica bacterium]|nr:zf-HC2 domain-containing protein [Candidatus Omnitrophota bacterium]
MNDCAKVKRLLSRYVDKEISPADSGRVKEHLVRCAGCRRELSEYSRIKQLVSAQERKELPPDYLVSRLREKIAGQPDSPSDVFWSGLGNLARRFIPVPAAVAVVSIVLMIAGPWPQTGNVSFSDNLLNDVPVTTETALGVILGFSDY